MKMCDAQRNLRLTKQPNGKSKPDLSKMPTMQVQQKTQFRVCKDYYFNDVKIKELISKHKTKPSFENALTNYINKKFPSLLQLLNQEEKEQF